MDSHYYTGECLNCMKKNNANRINCRIIVFLCLNLQLPNDTVFVGGTNIARLDLYKNIAHAVWMVQNGRHILGSFHNQGEQLILIHSNGYFLCVFGVLVSSSIRKISTTTTWSSSRNKRRSFKSNRITCHFLLSHLGPMGAIYLRPHRWQVKHPIRSPCRIACWISRTILSNDSTNGKYSPVSWESTFLLIT